MKVGKGEIINIGGGRNHSVNKVAELIGGNISVTNAKPEIIKKAADIVQTKSPTTKLLCGAGVHSAEDVRTASRLGCQGGLISHAIVNARKPAEKLRKILG